MSKHTYKMIELVGSSHTSIESASGHAGGATSQTDLSALTKSFHKRCHDQSVEV